MRDQGQGACPPRIGPHRDRGARGLVPGPRYAASGGRKAARSERRLREGGLMADTEWQELSRAMARHEQAEEARRLPAGPVLGGAPTPARVAKAARASELSV